MISWHPANHWNEHLQEFLSSSLGLSEVDRVEKLPLLENKPTDWNEHPVLILLWVRRQSEQEYDLTSGPLDPDL